MSQKHCSEIRMEKEKCSVEFKVDIHSGDWSLIINMMLLFQWLLDRPSNWQVPRSRMDTVCTNYTVHYCMLFWVLFTNTNFLLRYYWNYPYSSSKKTFKMYRYNVCYNLTQFRRRLTLTGIRDIQTLKLDNNPNENNV